jgi:hypothetical protein
MTEHGTVENYQAVDVHELYRAGALREALVAFPCVSFKWPGLIRLTANKWRVTVQFPSGSSQTIWLRWSPCHFGGWRPWFVCCRCDRRVGKLYNTGVALTCRQCLRLWYASQRRGAKSRCYLQALRLRLSLNGIANLKEPIPKRPKRMHKTTYMRLRRRLENLEEQLGHSSRFVDRETDYGPLVPK